MLRCREDRHRSSVSSCGGRPLQAPRGARLTGPTSFDRSRRLQLSPRPFRRGSQAHDRRLRCFDRRRKRLRCSASRSTRTKRSLLKQDRKRMFLRSRLSRYYHVRLWLQEAGGNAFSGHENDVVSSPIASRRRHLPRCSRKSKLGSAMFNHPDVSRTSRSSFSENTV